jgi:cytochrome c-type biogenesis protein CcmH/NrfG
VDAESDFRALLALEPNRAVHAYNLGLVLERTGRAGEARALWEKALAGVAPSDPLRAQIERKLASHPP